ncbi:hypothetical protein EBQ81_05385, partial [bacterium]|nr:hypothetical protein [bacterium]
REKASMGDAVKGNEKQLESLRKDIIRKTADTQKEIDSAKTNITKTKEELKQTRLNISKLQTDRDKYESSGDTKNYIETSKALSKEYDKINPLKEKIAEQTKQISTAREKAREIGFTAIRKDMIDVNKQDGLSEEQVTKATEELKQKQQTAIGGGRRSVKDSQDSLAKATREGAQGGMRSIFNPNIHSNALSSPITYWGKERAESNSHTIEMPGGIRIQTSKGISISKAEEARVIFHEYGHEIENGNVEAHDLCTEFLNKRTAGEKVEKFQKVMRGYRYKAWEEGSPDNFGKAFAEIYPERDTTNCAYYTGKRYGETQLGPNSKFLASTEVYSMGMELLYANPAKFAEVDPEWFDLISGIATGRLLKKTRGVQ